VLCCGWSVFLGLRFVGTGLCGPVENVNKAVRGACSGYSRSQWGFLAVSVSAKRWTGERDTFELQGAVLMRGSGMCAEAQGVGMFQCFGLKVTGGLGPMGFEAVVVEIRLDGLGF
jgi:hypothetical protein